MENISPANHVKSRSTQEKTHDVKRSPLIDIRAGNAVVTLTSRTKGEKFDPRRPLRGKIIVIDVNDPDNERRVADAVRRLGGRVSDSVSERKDAIYAGLVSDSRILPHLAQLVKNASHQQQQRAIDGIHSESTSTGASAGAKSAGAKSTEFVWRRGMPMPFGPNKAANSQKSPLEQALARASLPMRLAVRNRIRLYSYNVFMVAAMKIIEQQKHIEPAAPTKRLCADASTPTESGVSSITRVVKTRVLHGAFAFLGDLKGIHRPTIEEYEDPQFTIHIGPAIRKRRTLKSVFDDPEAPRDESLIDQYMPRPKRTEIIDETSSDNERKYQQLNANDSRRRTPPRKASVESREISPLNLPFTYCGVCRCEISNQHALRQHIRGNLHRSSVAAMLTRRAVDGECFTMHPNMPSARWYQPALSAETSVVGIFLSRDLEKSHFFEINDSKSDTVPALHVSDAEFAASFAANIAECVKSRQRICSHEPTPFQSPPDRRQSIVSPLAYAGDNVVDFNIKVRVQELPSDKS